MPLGRRGSTVAARRVGTSRGSPRRPSDVEGQFQVLVRGGGESVFEQFVPGLFARPADRRWRPALGPSLAASSSICLRIWRSLASSSGVAPVSFFSRICRARTSVPSSISRFFARIALRMASVAPRATYFSHRKINGHFTSWVRPRTSPFLEGPSSEFRPPAFFSSSRSLLNLRRCLGAGVTSPRCLRQRILIDQFVGDQVIDKCRLLLELPESRQPFEPALHARFGNRLAVDACGHGFGSLTESASGPQKTSVNPAIQKPTTSHASTSLLEKIGDLAKMSKLRTAALFSVTGPVPA